MREEFISISEFSKRAGVSRPTIYSKLESELSSFTKSVKGKTVINTKALDLFSVKESVKDFTDFDSLKDLTEVLQNQAETLRKELEIKNEQIRELNANLTQTHVLLDQQQKLQALSEQKRIETKEEPKQESLLNRDKFSTEAEYTKFLKRLLPNINMFSTKKDLQEQEYILELMSEEERQLIIKKGFVKGLDYLLDPSIKKD